MNILHQKYHFWWVVLMALPSIALEAQNPNAVKPKTPQTKTTQPKTVAPAVLPDTIKVPKFTVRFGAYNGSFPALADDLKKLIGNELIVADERGQRWNIIAFRFIWNRKESSNDIKTGKEKTITTYNIAEVDSSARLPVSWQNELKENLKKDEEFIFERIIIEHPASKRKMMAPDLRLKIIQNGGF